MRENLPIDLERNIGSERKDFIVWSKRDNPIRKIRHQLIFGFIWPMNSVIMLLIIGASGGYHADFSTLLMSFFVLIGLLVVAGAVDMLLKEGSLYVGTPKRLIVYRKGTIRSIDWEQFTGDIEVSEKTDGGSMLFKLRTGKMQKHEDMPETFVPEEIYISGIRNLFEVEKICRERIRENDPTPAVVSNLRE